jgi:hypothetical protein
MPTPFVEPASLRQTLQPEPLHDTLSMFVDESKPDTNITIIAEEPEEPTVLLKPMDVPERISTPFHAVLTLDAEPERNSLSQGMNTEWFEPTIEYLNIPKPKRNTRRKKPHKQRNTRSQKSKSVKRKRRTSRKRV